MTDIRGAIIEPITLKKIPGYFLFMENNNGKVEFAAEYDSMDPQILTDALVKAESDIKYHALYVTEENKPDEDPPSVFALDLREELRSKLPWVRIYKAPYTNNIFQGMELFQQMRSKKQIDIPKDTTIGQQLGRMRPNEEPDESLYAFHALRLILGGVRIQEIPVKDIEDKRHLAFKIDKRKGLDRASRSAWEELDEIKRRNDSGEEDYEGEEW